VAGTQAVDYRDARGAEPVDEFIQALPSKRAAKIDDFVQEHLNGQPPEEPPPPFPVTSQIEGELRELRVRFANTPHADIELAKQRMADFKRRMDAIRRTPPRAVGKDAPPASRPL
jgi:phage-related protein